MVAYLPGETGDYETAYPIPRQPAPRRPDQYSWGRQKHRPREASKANKKVPPRKSKRGKSKSGRTEFQQHGRYLLSRENHFSTMITVHPSSVCPNIRRGSSSCFRELDDRQGKIELIYRHSRDIIEYKKKVITLLSRKKKYEPGKVYIFHIETAKVLRLVFLSSENRLAAM